MEMYKINYLKKSDSICTDDLKNKKQVEFINLSHISSISDLKKFYLPFSGDYKGDYSIISMQNGDRFCIDTQEYNDLISKIEKSIHESDLIVSLQIDIKILTVKINDLEEYIKLKI